MTVGYPSTEQPECPVVKTCRETLDFCDARGICNERERTLTVFLALTQKGDRAHRAAAEQARRVLNLPPEKA